MASFPGQWVGGQWVPEDWQDWVQDGSVDSAAIYSSEDNDAGETDPHTEEEQVMIHVDNTFQAPAHPNVVLQGPSKVTDGNLDNNDGELKHRSHPCWRNKELRKANDWSNEEREYLAALHDEDEQAMNTWSDFVKKFNARFRGKMAAGRQDPCPERGMESLASQAQRGLVRRARRAWKARRTRRQEMEAAIASEKRGREKRREEV